MAEIKAQVNFKGKDDLSRNIRRLESRMNKLSGRMDKVKTRTDRTNKSLSKMGKEFKGLDGLAKKVAGSLALIFGVRAAANTLRSGAAYNSARQELDAYLSTIDLSTKTVLPEWRRLTQGQVSDLELMTAALRFATIGTFELTDGFDSFGNILQIGLRNSQGDLQEFSRALNEMFEGFRAMEPSLFRRFGIFIEQIQKERPLFFKQFNVLTKDVIANAPKVDTAIDKYNRLSASLSNLRTRIGAAFADSPTFLRALDRMGDFFNPERIERWAVRVEETFKKMATFFSEHQKAILALGAVAAGGAITIKFVGLAKLIATTVASVVTGIAIFKGAPKVFNPSQRSIALRKLADTLRLRGTPTSAAAADRAADQLDMSGVSRSFPKPAAIGKLLSAGKLLKVGGIIGLAIGTVIGVIDVIKSVSEKLKARGETLKTKLTEVGVGLLGFLKFIIGGIFGPIIEGVKRIPGFDVALNAVKVALDKLIDALKFIVGLPKLIIDKVADLIIKGLDALEKLPGAGEAIRNFRNKQLAKSNQQFLAEQGRLSVPGRGLIPIRKRQPTGFGGTFNVAAESDSIVDAFLKRLREAPEGPLLSELVHRTSTPNTSRFRGPIPSLSMVITPELIERIQLFHDKVGALADRLDVGRQAAELFTEALANGTEGLKQLGPLLGGTLTSAGAGLIGEGVSIGTKQLRDNLAAGALKSLGSVGANLVLGGAFTVVGGLLGKLFGGKEEEKQTEQLERIARNTDRGNQLLQQLIGAPSDFVYPNVSQLSYAGVSRATFDDLGR
jgi:hypothetical protein